MTITIDVDDLTKLYRVEVSFKDKVEDGHSELKVGYFLDLLAAEEWLDTMPIDTDGAVSITTNHRTFWL